MELDPSEEAVAVAPATSTEKPLEQADCPVSDQQDDPCQAQALKNLLAKAQQLQTALRDLKRVRQKLDGGGASLLYPAGIDEQTLFAISNEGTSP
ncbi:hypothetical protein WJX74_000350 [Apatococcus lobatus]|uniref:Uncharacterized protein n=1 Tax=Apatococcus lobatus TaxID=904363 RepID=A0AAW1QCI0_9CHLO